jgi:hypothetical protein
MTPDVSYIRLHVVLFTCRRSHIHLQNVEGERIREGPDPVSDPKIEFCAAPYFTGVNHAAPTPPQRTFHEAEPRGYPRKPGTEQRWRSLLGREAEIPVTLVDR